MADMAPALTGAAQEAPHRIRLGASSTAWKSRTGLLLLNGGRAEDVPGGPLMDEAPGPLKRGLRRPLRGPREEDMGPLTNLNSAPGPPPRPAPGAPTPGPKNGLGPRERKTEGATGPAAATERPKDGPGPRERTEGVLGLAATPERPKDAPGPREKRLEGATGPPTATDRLKDGLGPRGRTMEGATGPPTALERSKDGAGPRERRMEGATGPPATPGRSKDGMGPRERRKEGPTTSERLKDGLAPWERMEGARGPPTAPERPKDGPGPWERRMEGAVGPAATPGRAKDGTGPRERRMEGAQGPPSASERPKDGLGPRERRTERALGPTVAPERLKDGLGPRERRMDEAPGPKDLQERQKDGSEPHKRVGSTTGPFTRLEPRERRTDSASGPAIVREHPERLGGAPGPTATLDRCKDGSDPRERAGGAPGPIAVRERKLNSTPGPATPAAASLGNAKGHLAGQDLAPDSTGRTGCLSDCTPGPPAAEQGSASGPLDSQDTAPGPRVLCALRAAQMSSRQQELGARARRLCRRLQVIQAKQVERHVRQQLSGLVELLSERGAAGLPGSPHIELDRLACSSSARLRAAQGGFDSDATESSSGGESDEEEEEEEDSAESPEEERAEEEQSRAPGSNQHSEWRWAVERAAIICRWTWLQAQVSDLEFRIRQQTEIYKQIRCTKGGVVLGDSPHCEDSTARQTASSSVVLNARGNRVPSSCSKTTPKAPSGDDPCKSNTPSPSPQSVDKQCSRLTQSENVACQNPPTTPDSSGSQKTSRQVNGLINCVRSSVSCNGSAEDLDPEEVLGKKRRVDTPSTSPALSDPTCVSARTRPLRGHKKRSLVRSSDVSSLSRKPQKPLSTKCGCDPPTTCILCGCKTYAKTSHPSTMALNERISLMDPCYHPILSFPYDTPLHLHFQALLKEDRQFRVSNKLKILKLSQLAKKPQDAGRSMFRDDRQYRGVSGPSIHVSSPVMPRPNPAVHQLPSFSDTPPSVSQQNSASAALKRKRFENSYDIDNIVIPMSLVAASRVEKLQYKEILTPSWRVLDSAEKDLLDVDPQLEDLTDEAYQDRHSKYEAMERSRWDSWTTSAPQRRGSRSSNKSDGRWTPQPPNSQGSSQQTASPDIRFQSLNDVPFSLSSAAADSPEPYSTVQCLSVHSRTRVLSWSEDTRSSTPEIPDDEEQIVQPWEMRSFPLSDRDCRSLQDLPGTPSRGRTKPHPDVSWPTSSKPAAWTESVDSGMSTELLTPASKESPLPNSISVVRVRAHSGDKIASLEYFPPRPVNKR